MDVDTNNVEEENSDEKSNLLGGGSKDYEDDFFLTGPKINMSGLRQQFEHESTGPEFVDKNPHFFGGGSGPELMTDSFSGLQMERIKFKTWRDNFLIKSLVCALVLFVLIVMFVVIIHNSIF